MRLPFEAHENWEVLPFGEIVEDSAFGPRFSGKHYAADGDIATLRTTDLDDDGHISYETMPLARLEYSKFQQHFLKCGDLVITRSGTCGIAALFGRFPIPVLPGAFLIRFRLMPKVDPKFYLYFFNSPIGRAHVLSVATGAVQQNLNITNLKKLFVPVPPLSEQQAIVDILSTYDDLMENNSRRIKILEEMAKMIYREWFVNFRFPGHENVKMVESAIGLVPQGWQVGVLQDAVVLQRGFDLPTAQRQPGSVPIFAATGINGTHNVAKVKGPGVVTGRSGSLGIVILVLDDFWPLNTTLWVKEFRQSTPAHTYFLLKDLELSGFNSGAAVPTLNRNDIHNLPAILPEREVLDAFGDCVMPLFLLQGNLKAKNANLRQTRDLLLPKLISGEIEVGKMEAEAVTQGV